MTRLASLSRRALFGAIAALFFATLASAALAASVKGQIFVSEKEFGSGYENEAAMAAAFKKQSTATVEAKGEGGGWTINLAVFLKEGAGASKINIVYYDSSAKHEQVNFSEVDVQPNQKIVLLNGIVLSSDLGFVKGHTFEVLATRLIGGKEKVYAKGTMTLK
jgi:hypothetical protein